MVLSASLLSKRTTFFLTLVPGISWCSTYMGYFLFIPSGCLSISYLPPDAESTQGLSFLSLYNFQKLIALFSKPQTRGSFNLILHEVILSQRFSTKTKPPSSPRYVAASGGVFDCEDWAKVILLAFRGHYWHLELAPDSLQCTGKPATAQSSDLKWQLYWGWETVRCIILKSHSDLTTSSPIWSAEDKLIRSLRSNTLRQWI